MGLSTSTDQRMNVAANFVTSISPSTRPNEHCCWALYRNTVRCYVALRLLAVLAGGVKALRHIEAELRTRAERQPESPELWLTVRDVNSLVGRLRESDDWAWQTGLADAELTPADLVVLSALLTPGSEDSPYRDGNAGGSGGSSLAAIRLLHDFLARYMNGEFELEDAKSYRPADDAPAS